MKSNIKKYIALLLIGSYQVIQVFGMQSKKIVEKGPMDWAFDHIFLLMGVMVIAGVAWSLLTTFETVVEYEKKKIQGTLDTIAPTPKKETPPSAGTFWTDLFDKAWSLVPQDKEQDILFDHEYDGIRELDNNLPPWWVALFYAGVIAGVAYFSYYHIFNYGESTREAYALEVAYAERQVAAFLARQPDQVDENNVVLLQEEEALSFGSAIYTANCAACHGQVGEGGIGPNLTDPYWIHGGSVTDVFKTIKYGVPAKGMIAWKSQLRSVDIQKVTSYIATLQGTNPPKGKEPQGELYEPEKEETKEVEQPIGMK